MLIFFSSCFSDVALIIKYCFHDDSSEHQTQLENHIMKMTHPSSAKDISDEKNSFIKLPAAMFAAYLNNDCQSFIHECLNQSPESIPSSISSIENSLKTVPMFH